MLTNPAEQAAAIERAKAAEPAGGYQDISRFWYFTYFAVSTAISIAAAYCLADRVPKWLPPESPFFIVFVLFMAVGFLLVRRWHKRHNGPR
jgi:hypothetical protein